jgi:hypothetical protein
MRTALFANQNGHVGPPGLTLRADEMILSPNGRRLWGRRNGVALPLADKDESGLWHIWGTEPSPGTVWGYLDLDPPAAYQAPWAPPAHEHQTFSVTFEETTVPPDPPRAHTVMSSQLSQPSKREPSPLEKRLTLAVILDAIILAVFLSSDPNGNSMQLGNWLLLGMVFLAIAAWPWWWPRAARLVRGLPFTRA